MATQTENKNGAARSTGGRELIGVVTSNRMQKTVVVQVSRRVKSAAYKKYTTKRVKYKAHAESNDFQIGDTVQIVESRPLSKDKRWRVEKLITRAVAVD